jgi:hypothetical protein
MIRILPRRATGATEIVDNEKNGALKEPYMMMRSFVFGTCPAIAVLLAVLAGAAAAEDREYSLLYMAEFSAGDPVARASIVVTQERSLLREVQVFIDPQRHRLLRACGEVEENADGWTWRPPPQRCGALEYEVTIPDRRGEGYDAYMADDWAIVRLDDLFPPAATRTLKGAVSRASLSFTLPEDWSAETPYGSIDDKPRAIANPERRFDRPVGWAILGDLGVRRQKIADRRVVVAAPVGTGYRRLDTIAMLNWNLPQLVEVFPTLPGRLLIVGADAPMWRGGLSGPNSLLLHGSLPLISENGTSTLLHELVHVASGLRAEGDADWIIEGSAEYYGLELMRRSGTITPYRFERALKGLARWHREEGVDELSTDRAYGATTAKAVLIMQRLDAEIREASGGRNSLDDVMRLLIKGDGEVSETDFRDAVGQVLGRPSRVLAEL